MYLIYLTNSLFCSHLYIQYNCHYTSAGINYNSYLIGAQIDEVWSLMFADMLNHVTCVDFAI